MLEVSADQKLTARLTWNVAHSISIIPTKDITIKGPKNAMWFLANKNDGTMIIGSKEHKITLDGINDDRSTFNNNYVTRRENNTKLYLTNIEFKDFICGDYALIGCKNNGGAIYLEDIAFNNCSTTGNGLIENLREANDALYLKGFLNVGADCTGTTIYTAKNRIRLGDPEGTTIYDDFTATNVITVGTADDNYVEGTLLIVKVPGSAADKFKPAKEGWFFTRTASNGDMKLTQTEPTWLDPVAGSYTHPGLLHTAADITRVKGLLTTEPFASAYSRLETLSGGTAAGAVEYLKRMDKTRWESTYPDYSNFSRAVTDAKLAYELALRYQLKGSTAAATKAVGILNDWAANCKGVLRLDGYTNNIPDPN